MKKSSNHKRGLELPQAPKVYAERACNKIRHRSARVARLHIRSMVESGDVRRGEASIYCCPDCHWYHVASQHYPNYRDPTHRYPTKHGHRKGRPPHHIDAEE